MPTLSINRDPAAIQIEEFAGRVSSSEYELRIPSSLKERGMLGIEGLLIQLITTWVRNTPSPILHTHATTAESFAKLCEQLYGIYAIVSAESVLDQNRSPVVKRHALAEAAVSIEKVRQQDFGGAFKGHYAAIPSIRAPGTKSELDNPFYNEDKIATLIRFEAVIRKALYSILPQSIFRQMSSEFLGAISNVIRELFTNTHSYARKKENGDLYTTNIRAVTLCFHRVHKENLSSIYFGSSLQGVLSTTEWMEDRDLVPFLDITVVDGGPGFAGSWLKKSRDEISIDEEKAAVVECFKKHRTSSGNPSKGYGLTNVMREVKRLKGRMQITTGRVQLEKGYFNSGGSLEFDVENCRQLECRLEGTSISISLPFLK